MNYKRNSLRAPFRTSILFEDEDFVFKARSMNISEGGLLVDQIPHLPGKSLVPFMICLPYFPEFKNYSNQRLENYSSELFQAKVLRLKGRMIQRTGMTTQVDDVFKSKFGVEFLEISPFHKKQISEYVETYTSNIIYLQRLIEQSS